MSDSAVQDGTHVNQVDPPGTGRQLPTIGERDSELSGLFKMGSSREDPPPADPPKDPPQKETPAPSDPPPQDPPPPAAPAPAAPPAEGDSPELQRLLSEPIPTKNPKTAEQMEGYKKKWGDHVRNVEKKLKEIQVEADKKTSDLGIKLTEYEKQVQELAGYRLALDYQADPQFAEKHDKPIKEKQDEVRAFMSSIGIDEKAKQFLETVWGNEIALRQIAKQIEDQDPAAGEILKEHFLELRKFQRGRDRALGEVMTNKDKMLSERRTEQTKKLAERDGILASRFKTLLDMKDGEGAGAAPRFGFLLKKQVPSGATAEQRKEIDEHNRMADEENAMLNDLARSDDPVTRADQALMTRLVPRMYTMFSEEKARADALQKQLDDIKASGNFSTKRPAASVSGGAPPKPDKTTPGEHKPAGAALDEAFGGRF